MESLLRVYQSELQAIFSPDLETPPTMKPSELEAAIQNLFLFSVVWSLGASLETEGRSEFNTQLRVYLDGKFDERVDFCVTNTEGIKMTKPMPKEGSVFDWVYVVEANAWKEWLDTTPEQQLSEDLAFQNITILTLDVVRLVS